MDRTYIGVIDQGTTGTRFVVFDDDGRIAASAYGKHDQLSPEPGWVEHDPVEIWEATTAAVSRGRSVATLDPSQLAALGIANQRETTVVWDEATGEPVYNAIVWQDRRTTDRIKELQEADKTEWIRRKTGLEPDAYFSATKVEWILDNADPIEVRADRNRSLRERAAAGDVLFGTVDSWLIYNLTGEHVTDVSNASRTMLYNIHDMEWDEELLDEFDVPASMLPEVHPSSDEEVYGLTDADSVLGAKVPVTGALGDQQAAMIGQSCFDPGDVKNTYGTGSFYMLNTGETAVESDNGLVTTVGFQLSGEPVQYALEGSLFMTGGAIEWLDDVGFVSDPRDVAQLAQSVESTDGVYVVPPSGGLGTPHWDNSASGILVGATRGTRREHIVRAILESIGYQTRTITEAMEADAGIEIDRLRVGGAVKNDFLCQLQSDIVGVEIVRPVIDETTALGAAYAAGLAVGYWDSIDDLRGHWRADRSFSPAMDADEADRQYDGWTTAVEKARKWERGRPEE